MSPILEVEALAFAFDSRQPVLQDISFRVSAGECVGIVGANGAGKSTLLWCLLGLLEARGTVRFFGDKLGKSALRRIGVVFQNPEDQLFMPRLIDDISLPVLNRGNEERAATERALKALDQVSLRDAAERPAAQLSLGERKRAAIAAALAGDPELLLLDEPTAELDGRAVRQLSAALRELTMARLIASHDLAFLKGLTQRVLVLSQGRIIADGAADKVLSDETLLDRAGLI
jgi:cobalt/nickel transport system ATP-binding protein